jgi:REP element-mobilizing transposase RayT
MSRWHNYYLDGYVQFCTATVLDWRPALTGEAIGVIYDEWESARSRLGVRVLAFVVMPEHVHLLLWAERGDSVRRFLQLTLATTSKMLQPGYRFWKERPRVVGVQGRVLETKLHYIHSNPVRRGLAASPEDWSHSSFRQLALGRTDVEFTCADWDGISL